MTGYHYVINGIATEHNNVLGAKSLNKWFESFHVFVYIRLKNFYILIVWATEWQSSISRLSLFSTSRVRLCVFMCVNSGVFLSLGSCLKLGPPIVIRWLINPNKTKNWFLSCHTIWTVESSFLHRMDKIFRLQTSILLCLNAFVNQLTALQLCSFGYGTRKETR